LKKAGLSEGDSGALGTNFDPHHQSVVIRRGEECGGKALRKKPNFRKRLLEKTNNEEDRESHLVKGGKRKREKMKVAASMQKKERGRSNCLVGSQKKTIKRGRESH